MVDGQANLREMEVLLVDCQSTGASPSHGHLLELAWSVYRAGERAPSGIDAGVVQLPDEAELPRRIQRMTGISEDELAAAGNLESVWGRFLGVADTVGGAERAPAVIHYARFERGFLLDAHERFDAQAEFPLDVICTHSIAQRLFPELPRRGIRALAGYLGHTVPERKRAEHHVEATAAIWRHTVRELDIEWGVTTLGELREWLETREPTRRAGKSYAIPRETRLGVPDSPGVYRMLSKNGDVLYVGKATSLKQRVNSYFQTRRGLSNTKLELVTQVWDVDVTECASPLEAALVEADEIKRHSPAYNTALRGRDRTLQYANRTWTSFREAPDEEHRVGPLRDTSRIELLGQIRRSEFEDVTEEQLRYVGETPEMLREGVVWLVDQHGVDLRDPFVSLRRIALELWRAYYEEKVARREAPDQPEELEEDDADEELEWTPELVAEQLLRSIRWAYRSIRLSRWLYLLSDSRIEWQGPDGEMRSLIMAAGEVVSSDEDAPFASGALDDFDVATLDRLRVLTTELRRLVAADATPTITLSTGRTLEADQLDRLFRWI